MYRYTCIESALMISKRESKRRGRSSDLPTAVGPKRTMSGRELSGVRVAIPNLLRQDLLERGGDDLSVIRLQLVIPRKVDLNTTLHRGASHFIDVSLEAFQEIER
jgi:hypothetical protein